MGNNRRRRAPIRCVDYCYQDNHVHRDNYFCLCLGPRRDGEKFFLFFFLSFHQSGSHSLLPFFLKTRRKEPNSRICWYVLRCLHSPKYLFLSLFYLISSRFQELLTDLFVEWLSIPWRSFLYLLLSEKKVTSH